MDNKTKDLDVARIQTDTKLSSSMLTKAGIALLFLAMNPMAEQAPTVLPSFNIIVVGGADAAVDPLALTQRCNQCEAAVVLHFELEQGETDQ